VGLERIHIFKDNNLIIQNIFSAAAHAHFLEWEQHDDSISENFCDESCYYSPNASYVDLSLNPERYTGYKGESAHRIWHSIYRENCFRPKATFKAYIETAKLNGIFFLTNLSFFETSTKEKYIPTIFLI